MAAGLHVFMGYFKAGKMLSEGEPFMGNGTRLCPFAQAVKPQTYVSNSSLILQTIQLFITPGTLTRTTEGF